MHNSKCTVVYPVICSNAQGTALHPVFYSDAHCTAMHPELYSNAPFIKVNTLLIPKYKICKQWQVGFL